VLEGGQPLPNPDRGPHVNPWEDQLVSNVVDLLAGDCELSPVLVGIGRFTLRVESFRMLSAEPCDPTCHPELLAVAPPVEYRSDLSVDGPIGPRSGARDRFEAAAIRPEDLVHPATAVAGTRWFWDLESEIPAKVAGEKRLGPLHENWSLHWGGHAETYRDSEAIAVLEALERIAGYRPPPNARRWRGDGSGIPVPVIGPDEFGLARADWPFAVPRTISWTPGFSLKRWDVVALPESLVYYGAQPPSELFAFETSSGCAVGGTMAEAAFYGLLETIERDSFLIAWYGGLALEELDQTTVTSPSAVSMLDRMRLYGQRVWLFDCTVGLPVPTVLAVGESLSTGALCFGASARPTGEEAVRGALAEICSDFGLGFDPSCPPTHRMTEARLTETAAMLEDFDLVVGLEDHADLYKNPAARPLAGFLLDRQDTRVTPVDRIGHSLRTPPAQSPLTLKGLARIVEQAGFEAVIVDQTTSPLRRLGVRAVKAVVPGLLPIDFGWSVQRALSMQRLVQAACAHSGSCPESFIPNLVPHPFP
jgi:ribosomal protein S12 methylthiotransferase accessory factor